jgi:light-regulated signal transduction histidine kinase (bacteriophytochrome)
LLAQQLEGLTMLSRLGQQTLQLQAVDMVALAQAVADDLTAQHAQQTVQWQLAHDVPNVWADATLLRQVLVHVLDNALKFSRGREVAQVVLTWQTLASGQFQISIADKGVGFAPEQADMLFKVFGKLHSAREFSGLGLGLVASRKIMDRLGGAIGIDGAVGQGCCVTLDLQPEFKTHG